MGGQLRLTAPITDFSQYPSSSGHRAYCFAKLSVSSPVVAETIAINDPSKCFSVCKEKYSA